MSSKSLAEALLPLKCMLFIMLIMENISILYSYDEFILSSLQPNFGTDSDEYKTAKTQLIICAVLFIICLLVNLGLLLCGWCCFFDRVNIFQITYCFAGNIFLLWFLLSVWRYDNLWWIWGAFG